MLLRLLASSLLVASAVLGAAVPASTAPARIPVVLDTDIGDDIDDTFALLMLLRSRELDLKLVVTDFGDTVYRARLAAKLLTAFGRPDVPIGIGVRQGEKPGSPGRVARRLPALALRRQGARGRRAGAHRHVMQSKETVTIVAIGPAPNLEVALQREPRIAERARFVGMYGSLYRGYGNAPAPQAEWNVRSAVPAFRRVVAAPWPALLTPLDTCGLVKLTGAKWQKVLTSKEPGARVLVENYRDFCRPVPTSAART